VVLAGCGSGSSAQRPIASAGSTRSPSVVPNTHGSNPDAFYEPDPIRARIGQTITWTNRDTDPHDITAENGAFDSGPVASGGTFRWKALRPGTYRYFCTLHPEMHGTIIVRS